MFQTLRAGSPFYILEKGSDIKLKIAGVICECAYTEVPDRQLHS